MLIHIKRSSDGAEVGTVESDTPITIEEAIERFQIQERINFRKARFAYARACREFDMSAHTEEDVAKWSAAGEAWDQAHARFIYAIGE